MSVYGGDSWVREAQNRKRRVDDLMIEGIDSSVYQKLSNGRLACLVCPTNPVLDSPIMLSAHVRGTRHRAAELRSKDREFAKQEEVKKRLALSDCVNPKSSSDVSRKQLKITNKPLIARARKAVSEVLSGKLTSPEVKLPVGNLVMPYMGDSESSARPDPVGYEGMQDRVVREVQPLNYRVRQERELKFTAAGWKRDCHGRWFKDENVEFDSDEEDPNIVLNRIT